MLKILLTALCVISFQFSAAADAPLILDKQWIGEWSGTMQNWPSRPKVAMRLVIGPIAQADRLSWRMVYGSGKRQQTRPYELVAVDRKQGRFLIDEKNSIKISARLLGQAIYTHFEVGRSRLSATYRLRDGKLEVEILSFALRTVRKSGGQGGTPPVSSWEVVNVQHAILSRKPPKK